MTYAQALNIIMAAATTLACRLQDGGFTYEGDSELFDAIGEAQEVIRRA